MSKLSINSVCCSFCGLLCDDLQVTRAQDEQCVRIESGGCERAHDLFKVPQSAHALVDGEQVDLETAYDRAADILSAAANPLVGGLGCDVTGHRAAIMLAEQCSGVVDHMDSDASFRNTLVLQNSGWMTTTLSEVRNRADVIVLAGTSTSNFPRFIERCVEPESQFGKLDRELIVLGDTTHDIAENDAFSIRALPVEKTQLLALFSALLARLSNMTDETAFADTGLSEKQFDQLLDTLLSARYGVLVWDTSLMDWEHADLVVQLMVDLVNQLNQETRWSGLPLGGANGGVSAMQVCTWQTGYPLRVSFTADGPRYEPLLYSTENLLQSDETDALLWISAFDRERAQPKTTCPSIVFGRADLEMTDTPDVFIPVAVPGVQQSGFLHRMDAIVVMPLQALNPPENKPNSLPGVAEALTQVSQRVRDKKSSLAGRSATNKG